MTSLPVWLLVATPGFLRSRLASPSLPDRRTPGSARETAPNRRDDRFEPHPRPLSRELHEHFTDPELVELTFLIGYINMLKLFNNALGVRYNGEYSLLRPVAG